jgi:hypothetical protein
MWRVVLGFILAPAAPLLPVAPFALFGGIDVLGPVIFLVGFYSYPLALVFGVPAYLVLRRFGRIELRHTLLAGATIGSMPSVYIAIMSIFNDATLSGLALALFVLLYGIPLGLLCSTAFWYIAEFRRGAPQA